MSIKKTNFKHVSYLWDDTEAAKLAGDEVALLIYRSNLLGADLRLTNYGGGNTSCKAMAKDPLTGAETEVMWVKGSGGDLGTLKKRKIKNPSLPLAEERVVERSNDRVSPRRQTI